MNALRTRHLLLVAGMAALCLPAAAAAAEPVPAGNPAAIQYTETFPSAGGPRNAEGHQQGNGRKPAHVLGQRNTRSLESQGEDGREAARLAAETAPTEVVSGAGSVSNGGKQAHGNNAGGDSQARGGGNSADGDGGGSTGSGRGGSGLSEVLGQATGSSSGDGISPLLPLVIFGTIVWSLAYLLRQRRSQAE